MVVAAGVIVVVLVVVVVVVVVVLFSISKVVAKNSITCLKPLKQNLDHYELLSRSSCGNDM